MYYPKEFRAKIRDSFPNDGKLREMIANGDQRIGEYLKEISNKKVSPDEILEADSLETLQKKAEAMKKEAELADDCFFEFENLYLNN